MLSGATDLPLTRIYSSACRRRARNDLDSQEVMTLRAQALLGSFDAWQQPLPLRFPPLQIYEVTSPVSPVLSFSCDH